MRPDVTAIIPTHNRARIVVRALASALAQRAVSLEVIVVDDGSTDDTAVALAAHSDPRLRAIHLPVAGGVAHARNVGASEARGEWLAFLDDDDLWAPHKLERQLAAARASDAVFAYGAAIDVDSEGEFRGVAAAPDPSSVPRAILDSNVVPGGASNAIVRADLLARIGGFDESLAVFADWDCWIRATRAGGVAVCEDTVVAYRVHGESMSGSPAYAKTGELGRVLAKHAALRAAAGADPRGAEVLRWIAFRDRLAGHHRRAAAVHLQLARSRRSPRHLVSAAVLGAGGPAFRAAALGRRWAWRVTHPRMRSTAPAWYAVMLEHEAAAMRPSPSPDGAPA